MHGSELVPARADDPLRLVGSLPAGVSGKDVFLAIADRWGDATGQRLEYGGPGLATIPMSDRRTIATQGAEISADFSTFEHDSVLEDFLQARGVEGYDAVHPDPDASYAAYGSWTSATSGPVSPARERSAATAFPSTTSSIAGSTRRSSARAPTASSRTSRSRPGYCTAGGSLPGSG